MKYFGLMEFCKRLGFTDEQMTIHIVEKCPKENFTMKSNVVQCGKDGFVWVCVGKLEQDLDQVNLSNSSSEVIKN